MFFLPRPEYPRPQFMRNDWLSLNGQWSCVFDYGKSGIEQKFQNSTGFEQAITVPFCPESRLSGIAHSDFIEMMWYHRTFNIPKRWEQKKILLHFGGVDYECEVFIDGQSIGRHVGGSSPFSIDLTQYVSPEKLHHLVVMVKDEMRNGIQGFGKQSPFFHPIACCYSRITGIWQSVWLEAVSPYSLASCRIFPDLDNGAFTFIPEFFALAPGESLKITVSAPGQKTQQEKVSANNGVPITIKLDKPIAWDVGNPFLYDIKYQLYRNDGTIIDEVSSYAGLRKIKIEADRIYLNNKPIFLRLILDQGYYPDGLWTAPSDEALKNDIKLAMRCGFNGARLHQKIFEERFYYWADHLGYLVISEFPDWGIGCWSQLGKIGGEKVDYYQAFRNFFSEWCQILKRDFNHPSIITWTPFNETHGFDNLAEHRRFLSDVYNLTHQLDPTRPVNDSSGWIHAQSDLWTIHAYDHTSQHLAAAIDKIANHYPKAQLSAYNHQPFLVDEYGGVKYIPDPIHQFNQNSWGYGDSVTSQEEAINRIKTLTETLLSDQRLSGYCYTQLTDIEQEQNGLYNYDRTPKFNEKKLFEIFSQNPTFFSK